jgi:multiple antibiotic resistance protein
MDFSLVLNFFIAVLAILNPIGNIPIFLEHVNTDSNPVQENIAKLMAVAIFVLIILISSVANAFGWISM